MNRSLKIRLWLAFGAVVLVIASLIGVGIAKSTSYYLTVTQVFADEPSPNAAVTVSGVIAPHSVHWNSSTEALQFAICDQGKNQDLVVDYHGARPQDFSKGWPVIVTGSLINHQTLKASNLEIKCPSKYEAKAPSSKA
nr:cytochrome c maturation protein CcmE [Bacilli bacterium]